MAFLVTTTGVPATVIISDLGERTLVHPIVNLDLELEYSISELSESWDLQTVITAAELTATDGSGNPIDDVTQLTDLQSAYNAGDPLQVEVITDATLGPLTIKRGSASDADIILEGQRGAGTATFTVSGTGDVVAGSFNGVYVSGLGVATTYLDGTGNYSTPGVSTGTAVAMLASSPSVGNMWFNTDDQKLWCFSERDLWFVPGETMIMNKLAGVFAQGELMIPDATLTEGCEIATTIATNEIIGVNVWDVDTELYCVVAYAGLWPVLCSDDSNPYAVGDFLVHDGSPTAEDGQAKLRSSGNGHMAICMESGSVAGGGGLLQCQVQTTERY